MTAADLAQSIRRELPYLRRYARALTGSQTAGDNYAAATLEAILSDRSLMNGDDTRIGISAGYSGSASNRSCIPYHDALVSQANGHAAETRRYDEE